MSLFKILKSRELVNVKEVNTDFGPGYRIDVTIGDNKRTCHLIQDKQTGEWKTLGDETACQILRQNLLLIGTPVTGPTTGQKLREQGE